MKILEIPNGQTSKAYFECSCGNTTKLIYVRDVRRGHTTSCGCSKLKRAFGSDSKIWKGYGEISRGMFSGIAYDAKKRKIEFDLTIEYLWDLYVQQNRLCKYSGTVIGFERERTNSLRVGKRKVCTASLDRISSSIGYVVGNVQWIHKVVNFMKQALPEDEFLEWVERIYIWRLRA